MKKLISDGYRALNVELHGRNNKYGGKGDAWTERVVGYIEAVDAQTYLDYGCGKGNLADAVQEALPARLGAQGVRRYDPSFVELSGDPEPADFVTCNDVLEHIEPDLLDNVLEHIASKIKKQGLLVISQRLANKKLADGRNAHLIVKKTPWWMERLNKHFGEVIEVAPIKPKRVGIELAVLVKPK